MFEKIKFGDLLSEKNVIGLPDVKELPIGNSHLKVENGTLYVNGHQLEEDELRTLAGLLNKVDIINGYDDFISCIIDRIDDVKTELPKDIIEVPIDLEEMAVYYDAIRAYKDRIPWNSSRSCHVSIDLEGDDRKKLENKILNDLNTEFKDLDIKIEGVFGPNHYGNYDHYKEYVKYGFWTTYDMNHYSIGNNTILNWVEDNYNTDDVMKTYRIMNYNSTGQQIFATSETYKLAPKEYQGSPILHIYNSKSEFDDMMSDLNAKGQKFIDIVNQLKSWNLIDEFKYDEEDINGLLTEAELVRKQINDDKSDIIFCDSKLTPKQMTFISNIQFDKDELFKIFTDRWYAYVEKTGQYIHPIHDLCDWYGDYCKTMAGAIAGSCCWIGHRWNNDGDSAISPTDPNFLRAMNVISYCDNLVGFDRLLLNIGLTKVYMKMDEYNNQLMNHGKSEYTSQYETRLNTLMKVFNKYKDDPDKVYNEVDFDNGDLPFIDIWGMQDFQLVTCAVLYAAMFEITDMYPEFLKDKPILSFKDRNFYKKFQY